MGTDDRRAAISAAMDELEESPTSPPPAPEPPPETAPDTVPEESAPVPAPAPEPGKPEAKGKVEPAPKPEEGKPERQYAIDKPPQSWRADRKAKWATVDPDVRQEIIRRDREVDKALSESASARQAVQTFSQMVQPFMARIQAHGVHPLQAVQELFKADYILSSAPKVQRAQFMAKLISDYDIDLVALDEILSGKKATVRPDDQVAELVQRQLQPFMQFIENQRQSQAEMQYQTMSQQQAEIEAMAENTAKYPEFENLREDMADIVDLQAKKGVYLTLEQAYTRAVAMNPEVSARVQEQMAKAQKAASVLEANAKAQRALSASRSVSGSPQVGTTGATTGNDRRATIAAAFDQLEGR